MANITLEESYQFFKATLMKHVKECIPACRAKPKKLNLYMNSQALNLKKLKRELWAQYTRSNDAFDLARFKRCRNKLRGLTRSLRREFEKDVVINIKHDVNKFWSYSRMKTRSGIGTLQDKEGLTVEEDQEKAILLNNFFSSVFTIEDTTAIPAAAEFFDDPGLNNIPITEDMVLAKLEKLTSAGSPGPDEIHPRILKETARTVAKPLLYIFRKSLLLGELPHVWKQGSVIPIFKKGDKIIPGKYRTVSLTSVPGKILESIVRDYLMDHMTSTGQLTQQQHGFRARRSCTAQMLEVLEDWTELLEKGEPVDALYLDFRKAFDAVPHQRLLVKLRACGVSGTVFDWICSFLKT